MRLYVTKDRDGNFVFFTEEPAKGKGDHGAKWRAESVSYVVPDCHIGLKLHDLLKPLSFEAGQLAEIEIREVARWE